MHNSAAGGCIKTATLLLLDSSKQLQDRSRALGCLYSLAEVTPSCWNSIK
jgi:hypothetical protein